ncbi:DMT family transporter [Sphingomonas sp.]|uniref:DMT family transporter n=1 Tax=Sphingomonas sp. TaxID=28214 RepID=UPI002D80CD9F|nr:DMT family transporter [Sphingomonas sp.]HEU0043374.1 DMT family transporter [Sphingomonas sp.]
MNEDRLLPAIALRLTAAALFSLMNLFIKLAEQGGAAFAEILFARQFGAAVLVAGVVAAGPGFASLRTERMPAHLLRCVVGLVAMALTFSAILMLPLAESTTIGFSMPIFATVLGALVLREPTGWRRWAAVGIGFAGVLIVAQPSGDHMPLAGAALGLTAAFCTALVTILLRQIGRTEAPKTTVFWFSALSSAVLLPFYLANADLHPPLTWAILAGIGALGGVAQLAMTGSLARGPVSVVVPMDYTSLLWAMLLGWAAYGTLPVAATLVGAPLIVGSGLFIVWREHRRRREEVRQASADGIV